ncbi:MAG: autoinducer binding domain-containing protein [Cocleimonas sp.]
MLSPYQSILHQLEKANSLDDIWDIAVNFFKQQGISHIIYVYCRAYENNTKDTILLTTMPDWWVKVYQDNDYAEIDPFFTHCCKSYDTLKTGIEYYNDYDFLSQVERELIEEASQTGFISGASFTMRKQGIGSDFGGWNLGTSLKRKDFDKLYAEKGEILRIVAMYMHEQINIKLNKDIVETKRYTAKILSDRQIDCLKLLAKGKRIQQIADILNIKPVTVDHHIKLARENLHATTREQAIARAIIKRLILIN